MTKEWSVDAGRDGYVNEYELDCDGLTILNLDDEEYCILHWLAVLLRNREFDIPGGLALEAKEYLLKNFAVDYSSCDVMIGYRADDSYFSFAQDFINGTISCRQLANAMHLGRLGRQVVLKSRKAFEGMRFLNAEGVSSTEWFDRKRRRDRSARREYFSVERNQRRRDDLFITQIIDEEVGADDPRLR